MIKKTEEKKIITSVRRGDYNNVAEALQGLQLSINRLYFAIAKELWQKGGESEARKCLKVMREQGVDKKIINALGNAVSAIKRAKKLGIDFLEFQEVNSLKKACKKAEEEKGDKEKEAPKKKSKKVKGRKENPAQQIIKLFQELDKKEKEQVLDKLMELV